VHSSEYLGRVLNFRGVLSSSDEVDAVSIDKDSNIDVGASLEEGQDGRNVLKLTMPDPTNVFGGVLQYMYEGSILVDENNAVPILSIAEYLKIEDLQKRVQEYLSSSLTRSTVLLVLKRALEIKTSIYIFNLKDSKDFRLQYGGKVYINYSSKFFADVHSRC
jgi:hypothetical protein